MSDEYTLEQIAEHRKLFVSALRSGLYEEGKENLRTASNVFCPMGVACNVSKLGVWGEFEDDGDEGVFSPYIINPKITPDYIVPYEVNYYYGITGHQETEITDMNDRNDNNYKKGELFNKIADYVESLPVHKVNDELEERKE